MRYFFHILQIASGCVSRTCLVRVSLYLLFFHRSTQRSVPQSGHNEGTAGSQPDFRTSCGILRTSGVGCHELSGLVQLLFSSTSSHSKYYCHPCIILVVDSNEDSEVFLPSKMHAFLSLFP